MLADWCRPGEFVCGSSRHCVGQSRVCDGVRDCPDGEDERKCAALMDEPEPDPEEEQPTAASYDDAGEDGGAEDSEEQRLAEEDEAPADEPGAAGADVASGREISLSKLANELMRAERPVGAYGKPEVVHYNDRGYLNVRKNGRWGKLCLSSTEDLLQQRQLSWSIEDLGRAVCKAITYQCV